MKKILLIAALTMASAPAFASKARMTALSNAAHIVDVQTSFEKPWQFAANGELATIEFGPANTAIAAAGDAKAEGGFVRQMNDSYLGAYVGRSPTALVAVANQFTYSATAGTSSAFVFQPNNPLNLFYASKAGDITWGANLFYLSSNVKTATSGANSIKDRKTNATGFSVGASNGTWDVSLVQGLSGKGEFTTAAGTVTATAAAALGGAVQTIAVGNTFTITSKNSTKLMGGYKMDSLYYYGAYTMGGSKVENGSTEVADLENTDILLGAVNTHKADGVDFFYGIAVNQTTAKNKTGTGTKAETLKLPMIVGVEADATSYLVVRGSLTQNFPLIGSTKTDDGNAATTDETDTLGESTAVNAGVGLKLGKFLVDATATTATDAKGRFGFDAAGFVANASLTYNF